MSLVVLAIPQCPACGGSSCLAIRVVRIPSLFGIQIFPWYHKRSFFHWHSPSAIALIFFFPWSKLLLISWISSSILLASCISPLFLSWNSVVSNRSSLISWVSGMSQYRSFCSQIPTFLVSLSLPAVGRSPSLLLRESDFPSSFPGGIRSWSRTDLILTFIGLVVHLVPSLSLRLLSSCSWWEPVQTSGSPLYMVSIRRMPELLLLVPCRVCRSCIQRLTSFWIGMPLVSTFRPGTVVTVSRSRGISKPLFQSWLVWGGWSRPILEPWSVLSLVH